MSVWMKTSEGWYFRRQYSIHVTSAVYS